MKTETTKKISAYSNRHGDKLLEIMERCDAVNTPGVPEEDAILYLKELEGRMETKGAKPVKIIAVDFDGTLCRNIWPDIGEPNMEVIDYIMREKSGGAKLILWTNRTGDRLNEALEWLHGKGIWFDAVNGNLPEIIEAFGGDCRKVYADEYIDDKMCTKFKLPFAGGDS